MQFGPPEFQTKAGSRVAGISICPNRSDYAVVAGHLIRIVPAHEWLV